MYFLNILITCRLLLVDVLEQVIVRYLFSFGDFFSFVRFSIYKETFPSINSLIPWGASWVFPGIALHTGQRMIYINSSLMMYNLVFISKQKSDDLFPKLFATGALYIHHCRGAQKGGVCAGCATKKKFWGG